MRQIDKYDMIGFSLKQATHMLMCDGLLNFDTKSGWAYDACESICVPNRQGGENIEEIWSK